MRKKYNEYKIAGENALVTLSNTKNIMICDLEDWERWKVYCWVENISNGYAETTINGKKQKYHYHLLENKNGYVRDHINRNKLDNRSENLRYATKHANSLNTKISKANKSGVKGVREMKDGRWHSYIFFKRKCIHLGIFEQKEEAINARKIAEEKYHKPIIQKETLK